MRTILMRALVVGAGLATGRLFIDLMMEPKPAQTAAAFSFVAFGVGFLISIAVFAVGGWFRSKVGQDTEHPQDESLDKLLRKVVREEIRKAPAALN